MESLSGSCAIGGLRLSPVSTNASLKRRPSTVIGRFNGSSVKCSLANGNSPGRNPKSTIEMLEKLLYPDSPVAQENVQSPEGLPTTGRAIMDKPGCSQCDTKGLVVCATCNGSGLYVDSILESQGIIVKVKCLGCGGSGNILCAGCGGRGHL